MHNPIPKTTFKRMMNLLMKLALVALVETTVVVSEKKREQEKRKGVSIAMQGLLFSLRAILLILTIYVSSIFN